LITAWQSGFFDVDARRIVDHCSKLVETVASVYLVTDMS